MSDPWEDFSSNTATTGPWTDFAPQTQAQDSSSSQVGTTPPATAFNQDKYGPGIQDATVPDAMTAYGVGSLAKAGISAAARGASSLFEASPDLLNAGIKPSTVLKMTPSGANPADYGKQLEGELNQAGAIGKNPSDTFQRMNSLKDQAGQQVSNSLNNISQAAGPGALNVNAETALKPVYDAWSNEVSSLVPDNKTISIFGKYYDALSSQAKNQGGNLTLDNLHDFLQEIGPKTHAGSEQMQDIYSKLYSAGANARDGVVNTVAQQANNPQLAQDLLGSNADYSKYIRLMPDVSKSAATSAVKQGISAFQKIGGPTIAKYIAGYLGSEGLIKGVDWLTGNDK